MQAHRRGGTRSLTIADREALDDPIRAACEDSIAPGCLIFVNRSTEVFDMATRETVAVERGDPRVAQFRELADRRINLAYGLAYAILRDRADAQDATHDAFIRAWDKWGSLHDVSRFEAWFDRILVNVCRNRLRRRSRWSPHIAWNQPGAVEQLFDSFLVNLRRWRAGEPLLHVVDVEAGY